MEEGRLPMRAQRDEEALGSATQEREHTDVLGRLRLKKKGA